MRQAIKLVQSLFVLSWCATLASLGLLVGYGFWEILRWSGWGLPDGALKLIGLSVLMSGELAVVVGFAFWARELLGIWATEDEQ